jgi:molybdopterin/thiamine biosynthesis adenylyltransferase
MLSKLGVKNVTLHDFDIVEEHNIPNQGFSAHQIGSNKADALRNMCQSMGGTNIDYKVSREAVTADTQLEGVVFMLTDTMKSREDIFKGAIKYKPNCKILIETRMGLDMCRIYCVDPNDLDIVDKYEKTLYGDENAEVSACGTSISVVTSAMNTATLAVRAMLNWNNGISVNNEIIEDFKYNATYIQKWSD